METLRYSFEILTKQFIEEQTRENFFFSSTPSPSDYKFAAPYFTKYNITPEEAFKVLDDFDIEPNEHEIGIDDLGNNYVKRRLKQDDLNMRIRALAALDMALNSNEFVWSLKKTANDYANAASAANAANAANAAANAQIIGVPPAGFATTISSTIPKNRPYQFFVDNIDDGIKLMRRLIGLLVMESISACSTDNCFNILTSKNNTKRTSISDKIDEIIKTNNQTIKSLNTDLNEKTEKNKEFGGIIQLDKQTIKSLNTMLSEKNNEIEKKQNENAELSKMYKSVFAEREEMVEKNKKLITIPNVLIVGLVCIIAYLFVTKK
jgi:hypothetical protein